MTLVLMTCFLVFGFALLLKGAEWLVDGACVIAKRARMSEMMIGLTLVSFGTSIPEFFINIISRLSGDPEVTLGDIIGSNIANILLVLGVSAVLRPIHLKRNTVKWEIPYALVLGIALLLLASDKAIGSFGGLSRWDGFSLLLFFAGFLGYVYRSQKDGLTHAPIQNCSLRDSFFKAAVAVPSLALGAKGVVKGAAGIASWLGISESIIGLTIVAIGTSLPELATSVIAALKKRTDIAAGNVIGSNIFNIGWILGASAAAYPLLIPVSFLIEIAIIVGVTALLWISVLLSKERKLSRKQGFLFLLVYILYIGSLIYRT